MPDFSRPEYASYVQLCRELRLEREYQEGDWFWLQEYDVVLQPPEIGCYGCSELDPPHIQEMVWLPALTDWLEMLKALGVGQPYSYIHIEYLPGSPEDREEISTSTKGVVGLGLTEEEASARLWMALKKG